MALPEIVIGSKLDAKGFKQAETAADKLNKNVKQLAATFGIAFSVQRIAAFGRESVKAFMDAEREGAVLANTMKNLGLSFETSRVSNYIESIGKLYGVTGDQAVPAMQALLSATGSVTKSQEMMNTALNIAAANNISVSEAATGLSQAYLGNRKALNQYNTGLTKAELQLKSFAELQKLLDTRLAGAATAAAATYSGELLILTEAANQAKEAIGKGLIDSFALLAGNTDIQVAADKVRDLGDQIAYALIGAADLLKKLSDIAKIKEPVVIGGRTRTPVPSAFEQLSQYGKKVSARNTPMGAPGAISGKFPGGAAYFAAQKKAEEEALKTSKRIQAIERDRLNTIKKIAAEKAKKVALDKLSAFLNKAENLFDSERIQLAAAAMGKQTEEDKVRIRLKQEILDLEQAISDGNVEGAARLAASIATDAQLLGQLRGDMIKLGDVPDPFAEWLQTLLAIAAQLALLAQIPLTTTVVSGIGMGGFNAGSARLGESAGNAAAGLPANSLSNFMGFGDEHLGALARQGGVQNISVVVNNAGSTITERDLVSSITQGIYNNQAAGIPINYNTVY